MRRLVWVALVLAVIWCTWWAVASIGMQRLIATWFSDQRAAGWQAEVAEVSKHGFPLTLHARLREMSVADPTTGVAVDAPQIDLMAAAYWPGFLTVKVPDTPIDIATPTGEFRLQTADGQANLRLHPSVTLQLQSMGLTSDAWRVDNDQGTILSADDLRLQVTQDATSPELYQFNVDATNLNPGLFARTALSVTDAWPASFDAFTADLNILFDTPWDRSALDKRRPQPRVITVRRVHAVWGNLDVSGTGTLTIDSRGIPDGSLSLTIRNWRDAFELAQASGAVPAAQRLQIEIVLGALSNMGGTLDDLDLTLSFENGETSLGPIKLGPAPQLIIH